jgi:chromosome segregation ATPase
MLIPRRPRDDDVDEPEETSETDVARRVLAHAASPEEKIEQLLAERSRELESQAARFEQAMADLERREELLRDMRASVERLLRQGTTDLGERESELRELGREFMEREARLAAEEAELKRRRGELGAVELKREALEQRERALAAREEEVAAAAEARAPDERDTALEDDPPTDRRESSNVAVAFVPGAAYRLVTLEERALHVGAVLDLDGVSYVVARLGRAPIPGDDRRCAYLEREPSEPSEPSGSSGSS